VTATGLPPTATPVEPAGDATVAPTGTVAPSAPAEPAKKKKRGFWARVFGVGKDEEKPEKPPEP
jgi:hypothetical protein